MRKNMMIGVGAMGMIAGVGGVALAAGEGVGVKQRAAAAAPIRPLTEADQTGTRETGCALSFEDGRRRTLVYAIGHDFMVRTRTGLQTCRISEAQFGRLSEQGAQSCGGLRITVRRTGRVAGNPETDSASGRARLTVTGGGRSWSTTGQWGSAC